MVVTLLHYLSFAVAVGGGTAVLILMARIRAAPAEAGPQLRPAIRSIATVGLGAISLLWLTGLAMWALRYGVSMELGIAWHVKLAAVVVLTALALVNWVPMRLGRPLPLPIARGVLIGQLVAAIVAMSGAILAFG